MVRGDGIVNYMIRVNHKNIDGGPLRGTQYSLEKACNKCGSGALRISPLILPLSSSTKNKMFATLDREIIISEELRDELINHGINCFDQVLNTKKSFVPFYVLVPELVLPPFSQNTKGFERERACAVCGRDGYFNIPRVPLEIHYDNIEEATKSKDLLCTYELFGLSIIREPFKESAFAAPKHIISERFKEILEKMKVKNIDFEPVFFD